MTRIAAFAMLIVACARVETSSIEDADAGLTDGPRDHGFGAVAIVGDIDRILLTERDDTAGTCISIKIRRPVGVPAFDVTVTAPWSVESIAASNEPIACDHGTPEMFGAESASDSTGTIDLYDLGSTGWPCTLDVDLVVSFDTLLPEIPMTHPMTATGIAIANCP